jgi:hypothetical protein
MLIGHQDPYLADCFSHVQKCPSYVQPDAGHGIGPPPRRVFACLLPAFPFPCLPTHATPESVTLVLYITTSLACHLSPVCVNLSSPSLSSSSGFSLALTTATCKKPNDTSGHRLSNPHRRPLRLFRPLLKASCLIVPSRRDTTIPALPIKSTYPNHCQSPIYTQLLAFPIRYTYPIPSAAPASPVARTVRSTRGLGRANIPDINNPRHSPTPQASRVGLY